MVMRHVAVRTWPAPSVMVKTGLNAPLLVAAPVTVPVVGLTKMPGGKPAAVMVTAVPENTMADEY